VRCRSDYEKGPSTVRQTKPIRAAIATIDEDAWVQIGYPDGGLAQVAETRYQGDRLIVRRTCLVGAPKPSCSPTGATTPSSPTGSARPSNWTKTTAATPRSSSRSATSKPASGCGTAPRASSPPTPPGS
jgi:hypothetical protein